MIVAAVLLVAAVMYALLSFGNHYYYHTYGLDLGVYSHALYEYAHLRMPDCSFFMESNRILLSDHFDLYLPLLSPLIYLFGQYTLLLVQIVAVLLGALGVYRLICMYTDKWWIAVAAMMSFLSFFGIWHALAFDYHSNVVACMWLPWLMVALRRQQYGMYSLLLILICIAKETLPLWMVFVLMALMWDYRRNRKALCWLGGGMMFCVIYLLIVSRVLMPTMCPEPSPGFWRYSYMGDNITDVAKWLFNNPVEAVRNLFSDTSGSGQKLEFYCCLFFSGGVICLLKPHWLLMLIPLIAQKMLSVDEAFWGIGYQYNVECATVVVPATFIALAGLKSNRLQYALSVIGVVFAVSVTVYTCFPRATWIRSENVRVFSLSHYRNDEFDLEKAREIIDFIPPEVSVSAASCLTPHLALRHQIYCYPAGQKAEYRLIIEDGNVVLIKQEENEYEE